MNEKINYSLTKFGARVFLCHETKNLLLMKIRKELILVPIEYGPFNNNKKTKETTEKNNNVIAFRKTTKNIYLPKFYVKNNSDFQLDLNAKNEERKGLVCKFTSFNGQLRNNQEIIVSKCLDKLFLEDACILSAPCGMGKTIMTLYIITQLKKKTIILLHKTNLLEQWKKAIETFLPNIDIGIIQQNIYEIENKEIVLCMIPTILARKKNIKYINDERYTANAFDSFGFCVIDECHHICSQQFSKILFHLYTQKVLGLSATPERKDGLTILLKYFMNDILSFENKNKNIDLPTVHIRKFIHEKALSAKYIYNYQKKQRQINYASLITALVNCQKRTIYLSQIILKLKEQGRKILVLSERRKHCEEIFKTLKKSTEDIGFYLGGMKQDKLDQSNEKGIILATFMMCSEGYDCKTLDTLVCATPKMNKQIIGRILRQKNTFSPLIIDIHDCGGQTLNNESAQDFYNFLNIQKYKRVHFYKQEKVLLQYE